jgi:hypothetical protein
MHMCQHKAQPNYILNLRFVNDWVFAKIFLGVSPVIAKI